MIALELPWPPSVNDYWKPRARLPGIKELARAPRDPAAMYHWLNKRTRGYLYLTGQAKRWRAACIEQVRVEHGGELAALRGPLQVEVHWFPPRPNVDIDNFTKPLFDGLEHAGLYRNDRQLKAALLVMRQLIPGGRVRLQLNALGGD